jgi:hypothetical protein
VCRRRGRRPAAADGRPGTANQGQRRNRHDLLSGHCQPLAAGCQHFHARAGAQQPLGERGHGREQVLAVVEHQQRPPRRQMLEHSLLQRLPGPLGHPEHRRHRLDHKTLSHGHQVGEGAAGREQRCCFPRHRHRQAGLAHTARTNQSHQAGLAQGGQNGRPLPIPAHETRPLRGQANRSGR